MADVTIRRLDDRVVQALKEHARSRHRSLEAELRDAITQHAERLSKMRRLRVAALRISAEAPPQTSDSVELLRELREERGR